MRIIDWSSDVCSSDLPPRKSRLVCALSRSCRARSRASSASDRPSGGVCPIGGTGTISPFCCAATIGLPRSPGSGGPSFGTLRSEEHTSELQSLMRISYAVFCLKKKNNINHNKTQTTEKQVQTAHTYTTTKLATHTNITT